MALLSSIALPSGERKQCLKSFKDKLPVSIMANQLNTECVHHPSEAALWAQGIYMLPRVPLKEFVVFLEHFVVLKQLSQGIQALREEEKTV